MRRKNPCWPKCTGEGRRSECHATCKAYAEYEAERFAYYEEHEKIMAAEQDWNEHVKASMARRRRKRKTE